MNRNRFSTQDLDRLKRQLTSWRGHQSGKRRLPDSVWEAATALAQEQGVSAVARTLGLDYHKLKKHVAQAGKKVPAEAAAPLFVELQMPERTHGPSPSCRAELCAADGARLTLHLPGDSSTVLALAQAFWRRAR